MQFKWNEYNFSKKSHIQAGKWKMHLFKFLCRLYEFASTSASSIQTEFITNDQRDLVHFMKKKCLNCIKSEDPTRQMNPTEAFEENNGKWWSPQKKNNWNRRKFKNEE